MRRNGLKAGRRYYRKEVDQMKEYGLYSGVTGGLVFGLGMCENEEEAAERQGT